MFSCVNRKVNAAWIEKNYGKQAVSEAYKETGKQSANLKSGSNSAVVQTNKPQIIEIDLVPPVINHPYSMDIVPIDAAKMSVIDSETKIAHLAAMITGILVKSGLISNEYGQSFVDNFGNMIYQSDYSDIKKYETIVGFLRKQLISDLKKFSYKFNPVPTAAKSVSATITLDKLILNLKLGKNFDGGTIDTIDTARYLLKLAVGIIALNVPEAKAPFKDGYDKFHRFSVIDSLLTNDRFTDDNRRKLANVIGKEPDVALYTPRQNVSGDNYYQIGDESFGPFLNDFLNRENQILAGVPHFDEMNVSEISALDKLRLKEKELIAIRSVLVRIQKESDLEIKESMLQSFSKIANSKEMIEINSQISKLALAQQCEQLLQKADQLTEGNVSYKDLKQLVVKFNAFFSGSQKADIKAIMDVSGQGQLLQRLQSVLTQINKGDAFSEIIGYIYSNNEKEDNLEDVSAQLVKAFPEIVAGIQSDIKSALDKEILAYDTEISSVVAQIRGLVDEQNGYLDDVIAGIKIQLEKLKSDYSYVVDFGFMDDARLNEKIKGLIKAEICDLSKNLGEISFDYSSNNRKLTDLESEIKEVSTEIRDLKQNRLTQENLINVLESDSKIIEASLGNIENLTTKFNQEKASIKSDREKLLGFRTIRLERTPQMLAELDNYPIDALPVQYVKDKNLQKDFNLIKKWYKVFVPADELVVVDYDPVVLKKVINDLKVYMPRKFAIEVAKEDKALSLINKRSDKNQKLKEKIEAYKTALKPLKDENVKLNNINDNLATKKQKLEELEEKKLVLSADVKKDEANLEAVLQNIDEYIAGLNSFSFKQKAIVDKPVKEVKPKVIFVPKKMDKKAVAISPPLATPAVDVQKTEGERLEVTVSKKAIKTEKVPDINSASLLLEADVIKDSGHENSMFVVSNPLLKAMLANPKIKPYHVFSTLMYLNRNNFFEKKDEGEVFISRIKNKEFKRTNPRYKDIVLEELNRLFEKKQIIPKAGWKQKTIKFLKLSGVELVVTEKG